MEQDIQLKEKRQVDAVNIIRGVGILMVFFVHYGQTFGNPLVMQFGQMGCQMFFVVSGYTCSISYRKRSIKDFYVRRYMSIAPGFYFALIVVVCANVLSKYILGERFVGGGNTSAIAVICNLLLIHGVLPFCNNSVFPGGWFVGTLVLMYLLHPIYDYVFRKAKHHVVLTVMMSIISTIFGVIINYYMHKTVIIQNNTFNYFLFLNEVGCYLLGILLQEIVSQNRIVFDSRIEYYTECALTVLILFAVLAIFYSNINIRYAVAPLAMGVFTFVFLFVLMKKDHNNPFSNVLKSLGRNSFYIFLTHTTVVWPIARVMKMIMRRMGVINDLFLFFIFLLPSALLVWIMSFFLKKICLYEESVLKKLIYSR